MRTLHRRLGLALGPAVLLWFLSGVVLLWVPYPSLTEGEWFSMAGALSTRECCVSFTSLVQILERPDGIESLRLRMVGDRPVVVAQSLNGSLAAVSTDGDDLLAPFTQEEIERIVQPFAAGRMIDEVELIDHDVWTVHQRFDPYRPLWKVQLSGEQGPVLYVSSVTGDVVQDTTADERRWNLVGAVMHWWYWPWLRRHWAWWDHVVWWASGVGTVMVFAGSLILSRDCMQRGWRGGLAEGRQVHRWLGVIAGISACCWMLSGWLSMDHGRWFSDGIVTADERERFMGGPLISRDVESLPDLSTVLSERLVKEIRIVKIAGAAYVIARESPSRQHILLATYPAEPPATEVPDQVILSAVRTMLTDPSSIVRRLSQEESGALSTKKDGSASIMHVETSGPAATWVQVDARTGTIVERLDSSRRLYHRLFDGLHRWNLPWLVQHQDVRRMLMSLWCLLGAGLVGSGMWMGYRRLGVKAVD